MLLPSIQYVYLPCVVSFYALYSKVYLTACWSYFSRNISRVSTVTSFLDDNKKMLYYIIQKVYITYKTT
jgi:hypothetical protein